MYKYFRNVLRAPKKLKITGILQAIIRNFTNENVMFLKTESRRAQRFACKDLHEFLFVFLLALQVYTLGMLA